MKLKNFEDLLQLLESQNKKHNQLHRQNKINWYHSLDIKFDINKEFLDSAFNQFVLDFLKIDFDMYSIDFKNKIVEFFNTYYKELFTDCNLREFCLLNDLFKLNADLKYIYMVLKLPFGNKTEDKFIKKKNTLEKKNKFLYAFNFKTIIFPSPYDILKNLQYKLKDRLIDINNNNSLKDISKIKRYREFSENDLILKLIKIVTIDNYYKDIENLRNFRLTEKTTTNAKKSFDDYIQMKMNNEDMIELTPKKKG